MPLLRCGGGCDPDDNEQPRLSVPGRAGWWPHGAGIKIAVRSQDTGCARILHIYNQDSPGGDREAQDFGVAAFHRHAENSAT